MPLLDSFTVDHTRMAAPAVRVAKTMQTPNKDTITVFDLRFCVPNQEILSERASIPSSICLRVSCEITSTATGGDHRHLSHGMPYRLLHEPDRRAG